MTGNIPLDVAAWGAAQLTAVVAMWVRSEVTGRMRHQANVERLKNLKDEMAEDRKKYMLREVIDVAIERAKSEHERIDDRLGEHETRIVGLESRVSKVEGHQGR